MPVRVGDAVWEGNFLDGNGVMRTGSGLFKGIYSAGSRFAEESGTNPDELLGAALAGCFSMALAQNLEAAGFKARRIHARSRVHIEKFDEGFKITRIELHAAANIPEIAQTQFSELAEKTAKGCPVSQALRVPIELSIQLTEQE